jgi:hypothetical protein
MPLDPSIIAEIDAYLASIITKVRIPELPPYSTYGELSLLDKSPIYMNSVNKTVWVDQITLKALLTTGGTGTIAPVIIGDRIIIDTTSAEAGGNTVLRPELEGKTYFLRLEGRPLTPGVQWDLLSGGFKMKDVDGTPYVLEAGQRFDAEIYELRDTSSGGPAALSSSYITGIVEVAANTALNGVNHANKLISIRAGATKIIITLPDIATTPENAIILLESQINNDYQAKIQTSGGQFIYMNNTSFTSIWIGKGETVAALRRADGWVIINDFGNIYKNLGKPYPAYSYEDDENEILCGGATAFKEDYPRLWAKVLTLGGSVTTDPAIYAANPGMWLDVDATTFKFPDLRDMFLRGANGETPGTFQDEAVNINAGVTGVHGGPGTPGTIAGSVDSINPGGGEFDLTHSYAISNKIGTETRPKNTLIMWVLKY